jgi:hypothetical protein
MTMRAHLWLTIVLVGGTTLITTGFAFARWRQHWPPGLLWLVIGLLLVAASVVTYTAVSSPDSSAERLRFRCIQLLIAVYVAIGSSMLLLTDALTRTH